MKPGGTMSDTAEASITDSLNTIQNESWKNKDIFWIYYGVVLVTLILMAVEYFAYRNGILIQFSLDSFAKALNACIVIVGSAEGCRSFCCSASQEVGKSTPVPAYKLRYLLGYMVAFIVLTGVATFFNISASRIDVGHVTTGITIERPDFSYGEFTDGLLSNFICYLVARYGDKIAENVDLSNLAFLRRKS
jgi:hypothetical protein